MLCDLESCGAHGAVAAAIRDQSWRTPEAVNKILETAKDAIVLASATEGRI